MKNVIMDFGQIIIKIVTEYIYGLMKKKIIIILIMLISIVLLEMLKIIIMEEDVI